MEFLIRVILSYPTISRLLLPNASSVRDKPESRADDPQKDIYSITNIIRHSLLSSWFLLSLSVISSTSSSTLNHHLPILPDIASEE